MTVADVSRATRVPAAHIIALEEDAAGRLPDGPYAEAYHRAVLDCLGMTEGSDPGRPRAKREAFELSLPFVRVLAVVSLLALVGLGGWVTAARLGVSMPVAVDPVHEVRVEALRTVHVKLAADAEAATVDREVLGGEIVTVTGQDRVDLDVSEVGAVTVTWNGREVAPVGLSHLGRHFIFVDEN